MLTNTIKLNRINKFFITLKKKNMYLLILKKKIAKTLVINKKKIKTKNTNVIKNVIVKYIIEIKFSSTNTLLNVTDFLGNSILFYSAGLVGLKGKLKKRPRYLIFKEFYNILISKCVFLKHQPIALHLKNVGRAKIWIFKYLKNKFFINNVRIFNCYPYNGCRKKKKRRK